MCTETDEGKKDQITPFPSRGAARRPRRPRVARWIELMSLSRRLL